jgi:hypothetical protein
VVQRHADRQPAVAVLAVFLERQRIDDVLRFVLVETERRLEFEAVRCRCGVEHPQFLEPCGRMRRKQAERQLVESRLALPKVGLAGVRVNRRRHGNLLAECRTARSPNRAF